MTQLLRIVDVYIIDCSFQSDRDRWLPFENVKRVIVGWALSVKLVGLYFLIKFKI